MEKNYDLFVNSKIFKSFIFCLLQIKKKFSFSLNAIFTILLVFIAQILNSCITPAKPTGLIATAVSVSEIDLNWNMVPSAIGYNIFYCDGSYITYTTSLCYKHKERDSNTTYSYKISAKKSKTCLSPVTSCVSATTLSICNPSALPKGLNQTHEVPTGPFGDSTNYVPPPPLNKNQ